ncbi:hypothetical protein Naga_103074g1, partial [Nannochloropsis gaditana]
QVGAAALIVAAGNKGYKPFHKKVGTFMEVLHSLVKTILAEKDEFEGASLLSLLPFLLPFLPSSLPLSSSLSSSLPPSLLPCSIPVSYPTFVSFLFPSLPPSLPSLPLRRGSGQKSSQDW